MFFLKAIKTRLVKLLYPENQAKCTVHPKVNFFDEVFIECVHAFNNLVIILLIPPPSKSL